MTRAERLADIDESTRTSEEGGGEHDDFTVADVRWLLSEVARLEAALTAARHEHTQRCVDFNADERAGEEECVCGAYANNSAIDKALAGE